MAAYGGQAELAEVDRIASWTLTRGTRAPNSRATPNRRARACGVALADGHRVGTDPDISSDALLAATDPAVSGTPKVPVRMTYATACNYKEWNIVWQQVGAQR